MIKEGNFSFKEIPAQHHPDMAPAAEREPEVVKTVRKRLSGDRHHRVLELGEVRQPLPPGLLHLAEHDLLVRAVQRLPRLDPPLERAFLPVAKLPRVTVLQILEQGRGVQRWLLL
ncbi:MAG: hypothetical protein GY794_21255 [bacterium]|nr:hypothetical protein [bacterium]